MEAIGVHFGLRRAAIKRLLIILLIFCLSPLALAEKEYEKKGVIREIDLADRTAIIGGYRFYFGSASGYQAADIETLLYSNGAFELLEVGMKVIYHFTPNKPWYRIVRLRQLPDDAWLDNDELPDAHPPWQKHPDSY